jgi:hypothetical protein
MEHLGVFGVQPIRKVVEWYVIRLAHLLLLLHLNFFQRLHSLVADC